MTPLVVLMNRCDGYTILVKRLAITRENRSFCEVHSSGWTITATATKLSDTVTGISGMGRRYSNSGRKTTRNWMLIQICTEDCSLLWGALILNWSFKCVIKPRSQRARTLITESLWNLTNLVLHIWRSPVWSSVIYSSPLVVLPVNDDLVKTISCQNTYVIVSAL